MYNRRLKQWQRLQWRKLLLKSEFTPFHYSSRLLNVVQFAKYWRIFPELNSKGLYLIFFKELENRCLVFAPSTKGEIRQFHLVVVQ